MFVWGEVKRYECWWLGGGRLLELYYYWKFGGIDCECIVFRGCYKWIGVVLVLVLWGFDRIGVYFELF